MTTGYIQDTGTGDPRRKKRRQIYGSDFLGSITTAFVPMPLAFPSMLPCQPILGSFSVSSEPNNVEFKGDVGSPMRRNRYTASRDIVAGTLACTAAQKDRLADFWRLDCKHGALSFLMRDWEYLTTRTFTFEQPPGRARATGLLWFIPLVLAREPE